MYFFSVELERLQKEIKGKDMAIGNLHSKALMQLFGDKFGWGTIVVLYKICVTDKWTMHYKPRTERKNMLVYISFDDIKTQFIFGNKQDEDGKFRNFVQKKMSGGTEVINLVD